MTREEWEAELRRLIWQEPSRPFVIELKSGERAEVVASHAVGFGGGNGSVVLPGNVPVLFRLTHIARIIETQATSTAHASWRSLGPGMAVDGNGCSAATS